MPTLNDPTFTACCLAMGIDLARSVDDLNSYLRRHRPLIAALASDRPDLWELLRGSAVSRRGKLAGAAAIPPL